MTLNIDLKSWPTINFWRFINCYI